MRAGIITNQNKRQTRGAPRLGGKRCHRIAKIGADLLCDGGAIKSNRRHLEENVSGADYARPPAVSVCANRLCERPYPKYRASPMTSQTATLENH